MLSGVVFNCFHRLHRLCLARYLYLFRKVGCDYYFADFIRNHSLPKLYPISKENKTLKEEDELYMTERVCPRAYCRKCHNVSRMVSRANEIYKNTIHGLATENVDTLKKINEV